MLDPARMADVLRRGGDVATAVESWRTLDERRKKLQGELDGLRQQKNAASDRMAKLDKKGPEFAATRDEMKVVAAKIKEGEAEFATVEAQCDALLMTIPNAPSPTTPEGTSEADNVELHTWGTKPTLTFTPKAHWDL